MNKIHVAVLRGGPSNEYDLSLKTGGNVLKHLSDKYHAHDILISKEGIWHKDGFERSPTRALNHIDVVFNALHGKYHEIGEIQKMLDTMAIPYTGSTSLGSLMAMNKVISKKAFENHNIKTPYFKVVKNTDDINEAVKEAFNHFFLPLVVKPAFAGSSQGITIVQNFRELKDAIKDALQYSDVALMEEYIRGKEVIAGIINDFRNKKAYPLLPAEVRDGDIYTDTLSADEKAEIQWLAEKAHNALGLRHYSRSDFIITPSRGIYIIEVNTLPSLEHQSLLHKSLDTIGCSMPDFLDHVLSLALKK